ncbi:MAG: hypothetical protein CNE92_00595 [SAR116 cluster bacterium MED-G05]|jgi:CspA family cold shock protein|nr:hypothetical protein [Rhodospirillaceae bacterium]PDH65122.1 MAG: hypothetical protein CNE92_00595 [SAR116 cluster bacterium MED-G05]
MTVVPVCVRVRLPLLVTQIASEMRVTDMTDNSVTEIVGPDEMTGPDEVTGPDEIAEHEDAASAAISDAAISDAAISDADEPETDDMETGDEEASEAAAKPKRRKASSDAPKSAAKAATKSSAKSSAKSSPKSATKAAAKSAGKSSAKSASPEDDMPATPDINVSSAGTGNDEMCEGELVWYNERKGYGFVRIGEDEVFLHRSTLDRFGLVRLLTGDIVAVSLSTNEHGQVIKDLLSVKRPLSPAPPAAHEPEEGELRAVVKFFNDLRGYGFVTADSLEDDVFVHSRVLNDCGFSSLIQGQKLLVKVDDSGRGLQVNSVRLLAD